MNKDLCKLLFLAIIFVTLSVAQRGRDDNVLKFKPMQSDDSKDDSLNILAKQKLLISNPSMQIFKKSRSEANNHLTTFKWSDCGNLSSTVVFKDIKLIPDPIILPGKLTVSADIEVKRTISGKVSAVVELKKIFPTFVMPIPCLGNFGSCNYKDVCALLAEIPSCPSVLTKHNIPCRCPFQQRRYVLPSTEFTIANDPVPEGDYTVKVVLNQKDKFIGCLDLTASFSP